MLLILECKADEKLAMTLGISRKQIRHQNDKGQVCNYLSKHPGNKGLVDEDRNSAQPSYLTECKKGSFECGIRKLTHPKGNQLIVLCPRMEDWVISACQSSDLDVTKFGLPDEAGKLHKEINYRLEKFEKLIQHLLTIRNPEILHLQKLLKLN